MDAWVFQAVLLCDDCASDVRRGLDPAVLTQADADGSSDIAPQGPFCDGGGEADFPQHCEICQRFLQNPLTAEGYQYVWEAARDKTSHSDVIREWLAFYAD